MNVLEVRELRKAYGAVQALQGISFRVSTGESVGLLGPNGAGKTTAVSLIAGLMCPDSGEILIGGVRIQSDVDPVRKRLGFVPQELALYEDLSALENLRLFGALYGLGDKRCMARARESLALVGLADRAKDLVSTFSGGMKRRLNLAAALLHDPEILLLDEPTVGVDPQSRNAIFENLEALKRQGKTLLYTTHYMEEVERLCNRVVIVDHGQIVADDGLRGLLDRTPTLSRVIVELADPAPGVWLEQVKAVPGASEVHLDGAALTLAASDLGKLLPEVLHVLHREGRGVTHIETERPNLEAVFLTLTGRSLRDP